MTQMTIMTLNLGYGIGMSPKQRHLRHYRHTRAARGGLGYTPEMRLWISKRYASKTRLPQNDDKQTRYPHKFVYVLKSESLLIHPKILTRKSESVLIHCLFYIAMRSEEAASGRFCRFKIIKASDHTNPELFCYLKLLFI